MLPPSLAIIGTHRELDQELNEIEDNISSFRNNHNLFNNKSRMNNSINQGEFIDDEEDGKKCLYISFNLNFNDFGIDLIQNM